MDVKKLVQKIGVQNQKIGVKKWCKKG